MSRRFHLWGKFLLWSQAVLFGLNSPRLAPNIPTNDTWLSSTMIGSSKFWIIVHVCFTCTILRSSFLCQDQHLRNNLYHSPSIWTSTLTIWRNMTRLAATYVVAIFNMVWDWGYTLSGCKVLVQRSFLACPTLLSCFKILSVFGLAPGLFRLPLNIFVLCLLVFDS